MPNLTDPQDLNSRSYGIYPEGTNMALARAGDIRTGTIAAGQGEDVESVLNRKLEAAGILASGTTVPTHDATSPLLFYKTDDQTLHIKQASNYVELADSQGLAADAIIGFGTSDPTYNAAHSSTSPLIYFNTSEAELWIKNTGRYTQITMTAGDIGYTPPVGNTVLTSSVDTVEDALNDLAVYVQNLPTTSGGGGGGTQLPSDWTATSGVTRILNKPDLPPFLIEERTNPSGDFTRRTFTDGTRNEHTFTLGSDLTTFASRYDERLFSEVFAQYYTITAAGGDLGPITLQLDVQALSSTGTLLGTAGTRQIRIMEDSNTRQFGNTRIPAILPEGTTSIRLDTTVSAIAAAPASPEAGIAFFRVEVKSTTNTDEITLNQVLNRNFSSPTDLEEALDQLDDLGIQPSQFETITWPGGTNGVDADGDGSEVRRTFNLLPNLQQVNNRAGRTYIARVSYDANWVTGSRTDSITTVNFTHNFYTDVSATARATQRITGQTATPAPQEFEIDLPPNATSITVGFTIPDHADPLNRDYQADARINVNNYRVDIYEGINPTGFTVGNRLVNNNVRTLQGLAQRLYLATADDLPVDASGFDGTGNLRSTDNTVQKVAQKFEDYVATAPNAQQVTISNTPTAAFDDPDNFIGGIRGLAGFPHNPSNVRDALRVVDRRLQQVFNPFETTQKLDYFNNQGNIDESFGLTTANTTIRSNPINIPAELRALSTDVDVRFRIRYVARTNLFTGNITLGTLSSDNPPVFTTITGTTPHAILSSVQAGTNRFITFEQTIAAANVPDTFVVQFHQTSGATTNARFDQGFVQVIDSLGGAGGVGGGGSAEPEIVWEHGPGVNDRATAIGTYNLDSGKRFSDYRVLWWWMDNSNADREAAVYPVPVIIWQMITGNGHYIATTDNTWRSTRYVTDTSWQKVWPSGGIRKIVGW